MKRDFIQLYLLSSFKTSHCVDSLTGLTVTVAKTRNGWSVGLSIWVNRSNREKKGCQCVAEGQDEG